MRLQVSLLRFSVVSVALGSDGNTLFPKIHRADSNGSPQVQGGGGGSQPGGSVAIAPSYKRSRSGFSCGSCLAAGLPRAPCGCRLGEARGSTASILPFKD